MVPVKLRHYFETIIQSLKENELHSLNVNMTSLKAKQCLLQLSSWRNSQKQRLIKLSPVSITEFLPEEKPIKEIIVPISKATLTQNLKFSCKHKNGS